MFTKFQFDFDSIPGCRALQESNRNRCEQIAIRMRNEARKGSIPPFTSVDERRRDGKINRRGEHRRSNHFRRSRTLVRSAEILRRRHSSSPETRRNHRGVGILLHIVERGVRCCDESIDGSDAALLG